jgi:hypothetical protein
MVKLLILLFSLLMLPIARGLLPAREIVRAKIRLGQSRLWSSGGVVKKKIVFLGTPDVAATSLQILSDAAKAGNHGFELVAVVSQPPAPSGRNKKITNSPVHALAEQLQLPVYTPESAKD